MKYPICAKNILDVTKPPYNADNTGKIDCTEALRKAIDDCLKDYIRLYEELKEELLRQAAERPGENIYIGAESGRCFKDGTVCMTFPMLWPDGKIIYFPNGEYKISDTVSYTLTNLLSTQNPTYSGEMCRNIHLVGESKEATIIKLVDNAKGFEKGNKKPVIDFNIKSIEDQETTNVAQMNLLQDITIDCGKGNDGAIGVRYSSSNLGRIENVLVKAENGLYGFDFDVGSEGCVNDVTVKGFDYGIRTFFTSPIVMDGIDLSENKIAGFLTKNAGLVCYNTYSGNIPTVSFVAGKDGRYHFCDKRITLTGDRTWNFVSYEEDSFSIGEKKIPKNYSRENLDDWVCVDDFGAVGDGKTDSTLAIQKAFNSGKSNVLFGNGIYLISRKIKIPATVKTIDFMFTALVPGYSLITGEMDAAFEICEEGNDTLFIENLYCSEVFSGFFRLVKQTVKRTVVLKDLYLAASLYFNTVGGSKVYFDNCFTLTNHYSQDVGLHRDGYVPTFNKMIPVEVHHQTVYGRNLNIERADVEFLNDGSEVYIDGYKTEGPGVMVKTINGGKTQLNVCNSAWWGNQISENSVFETVDSDLTVFGGLIFAYRREEEYSTAIRIRNGNKEKRIKIADCCEKFFDGAYSMMTHVSLTRTDKL